MFIKLEKLKIILIEFLTCSMLLSSLALKAQNFERFSNKEGFNQNTINAIAQDRYGFLWFGTPNGLIKYDGYEFETYTSQSKTSSSISSNYITSLFNDSNGILWIGTNIGLNIYVPWLEKFYTIPLSSKLDISHIGSGPDGCIWFSGQNKLNTCSVIDVANGKFKVSENLLQSHNNIGDINEFIFTKKKSIIIATTQGLKEIHFKDNILSVNSEIEKVINFKNFNGINVTSIKIINNILWVGSYDGLFKTSFENTRIHIIRKFNTAKNNNSTLKINSIFEDNNGVIWVGTRNSGLLKYIEDKDEFKSYTYNPKDNLGLSSNLINSIFQDNYNVLWIGTAQGGLNKLDIAQKKFINYSKNPYDQKTITDNLITSILEDKSGKLWISTYNKDLYRSTTTINDSTASNIKFENFSNRLDVLKSKDRVRCFFEDKKGFIWIGTDSGLLVYNPTTDRFKKILLKNNGKIVSKQYFRSIYQIDDTHLILLGSKITVINNPWTEIETKSVPQIEVKTIHNTKDRIVYNSVLKDKQQNLWFATSNGLYIGSFDGKKINIKKHITDEGKSSHKLSFSNVFSLHEDYNGHIWVGTFGGGLNKISVDNNGMPSKIEYFRKSDILPDDAIYGILQEDNSNLWISTDMGLVKFNSDTNKVDVFDVRDGLAQNNFRQAAYFKGKSGYFYFGGLNGLTLFKPENIQLNSTPPKIIITSLFVNNKEIKIGETLNNNVVLEKSITETEQISISQNEQTIAFQLVVEHTSTPAKNKLAYKLEGFNDNWIEEPVGKKKVTYTNLSAGDYVFKVKAANADGVWSSEVKSLNISVLPPWYQTWWSYLLFFILIVLISLGIIIYFVQHEKLKQRLKYEQLDKERLDTINQGKFRYFTNISHEFRTPLTLITGPLEHIMSVNKDPEITKYLLIIEKSTKRLLNLIDQLITFRKAEQGYIDLKFSQNTLGGFIYPTTEAFENYAIEKNINFFYKVNSPNENIVIDTEKVERILFNFLSNAFKNTPQNGSISIEADIIHDSGKKMIQIDVIDNGKGIPAKDLDNIFERFYQLGNEDEKVSGGGVGLAFCKSLVNLLEGKISVKSEPFVETRFSVLIPSGNIEDLSEEERNANTKSFIKNWVPLSTDYKKDTVDDFSNNTSKEHHLLIVEDEEDVQNFLVSTLSETYNVTIANNGQEALEKIKLKEPTLIISDVMMPEMDGFAFCEKIKSNPETCHIPVLLLTALGNNEDTIKGLEFGADEYVSKPFSIKVLKLRIKKLIDNTTKIKEHFTKKSSLPKKGIELSTRDKEFLKDVIKIMEANISDSNFGVVELSSEMNLSASHFYRRLKQLTGQIPNVYLRNFRLQRAAELLSKNDGTNVSEVMYQIGIESNSYFSTSFKKLYGVSPSEFLKRNKGV